MMSELKPEAPPKDQHSTHTFILQKYPNPSLRFPHPFKTETIPQYYSPIVQHQAKVVFNLDRKSYTPSFYFPGDQEALLTSDKQYRTFFDEKIEETSEKKVIMVSRPSSTTCMVCLQQFSDYLKVFSTSISIFLILFITKTFQAVRPSLLLNNLSRILAKEVKIPQDLQRLARAERDRSANKMQVQGQIPRLFSRRAVQNQQILPDRSIC